jgi:dethiobiotin synthetase
MNPQNNSFFVTGTDTNVGKTLVSAALLHLATQQGLSTFGLKPVAAGCDLTPEGLRNSDALLLQTHSSIKLPYDQINPFAFAEAKAPHIAAAEEKRRLSLDRIEGFCRGALATRADLRLVEGVGGWRVPLNDRESMSGLPQRLGLPVILVVGLRLGCLSHALLTAEAINLDGLRLVGWVANLVDPGMASVRENIATLKFRIPAPCIGEVPWLVEPTVEQVAAYLSLGYLLPVN